jgi:Tol biopolymer transport system component
VNLGTNVNSSSGDFGPGLLDSRKLGYPVLFFGSSRPGTGGVDIYNSAATIDAAFGLAFQVSELNTPFNDFRPTIRRDGLELFFDSNRPIPPDITGTGLRDLWVSTRQTVMGTWSAPVHLGNVVNGPSNDALPALSSDGRTLVFGSDRPGTLGGTDLYVTTRERPDDEDDGTDE